MQLGLAQIDYLTNGRIGQFDVECPACASAKRTAANRRRKVLRIWRIAEDFATYHCVRCGEKGHTRDPNRLPPDPVKLARARAEAAERERIAIGERLSKARWLWSQQRSIIGTPAEHYLRGPRGYDGPLPATLGFVPGRAGFAPAMIAASGVPNEPDPGEIEILRCGGVRRAYDAARAGRIDRNNNAPG
jgi:hypothetical protein